MEEQGADNEVHPLHIPNGIVVAAEGAEHSLQCLLTFACLIFELFQMGESPRNI